jgi:hypothetical protein
MAQSKKAQEEKKERRNDRKEAAVRDAFDRASRAARGEDVPERHRNIGRRGRTGAQIAVDQYAAIHLSVQGYNVEEIAKAIGVTPAMVQNDLTGTARLFRERAMEGVEEHRGRHLMMCDAAANDLWREWHRSKREAKTVVTEARTGGGRDGSGTGKRAMEKRTGQTGDVSYVIGMIKVLERSAKLSGLDKPVEAKVYVEKANATIDRIGNALVEKLHNRDPELLQELLGVLQETEGVSSPSSEPDDERLVLEHVADVVEAEA